MDPILLEIVLWIAGFAAIGSAVGVVIVLAGWWLISSAAAWLGRDETRNR
jgi:hypothetical protein